MNGLWHLTTRAIDPGLGVAVFDGFVAFLVILFTSISIARKSKLWPEARILHVGMLLLSIWFILHWIDVVVRHQRARVPYGYILVGCFYNAFRVFSDVFVLLGTWRVLIRYEYLRINVKETPSFFYPTVVAGLLWFLALYHLCLLFALSFAWLSFSDLDVINAIAEARSGFEIAFTALQFICTICTVGWAESVGDSTSNFYKEIDSAALASVALLIRSFCEVVIVGQLDRWPVNTQKIARARDVTYGLFSVIFVICITFAIPANSAEDPLVKREQAAVEEVTTWVIQKLAEVTQHGRKTAPTIPSLLETLESSLESQHGSGEIHYSVELKKRDIKKKEINRLKALYVDWEPIYKWPGKDGGTEAGGSGADRTSMTHPVVPGCTGQ